MVMYKFFEEMNIDNDVEFAYLAGIVRLDSLLV